MPRLPAKFLSVLLPLALSFILSDGVLPAAAEDTGSISGIVFFDADLDGERDPSELPARGITVSLYGAAGGGKPATTVSGEDGSYHFHEAGDQGVHQVSATANGCQSSGYYDNSSGSAGSTDVIDLGLPVPGEGRVYGVLWDDLNEDGARQGGEPGLADWYVYLFASLDAMGGWVYCGYPTVHTDSEGNFAFDSLSALPFTVEILGPYAEIYARETQWEVTAPLVPDTEWPFVDGMRFDSSADLTRSATFEMKAAVHVLVGTASLEGLTYQDSDGDNVRQPDEPVDECRGSSAPPLYRRVEGIGVVNVTQHGTCQDGRFRIDRLPAGEYNVGNYLCCCPPRAAQTWILLGEGETVSRVEVQGCPSPFSPTPLPTLDGEPSLPRPPLLPGPIIGAPPTGSGALPFRATFLWLSGTLAVVGVGALCGGIALRRRQVRKEGQ